MSDNLEQAIDVITKTLKDLALGKGHEMSLDNTPFITFKSGDNGLNGKGLLWSGQGNVKQLVFNSEPDRFFLSESVDLAKNKQVSIGNTTVLTATELGSGISKSNLREVGRLKGLIVDGSMVINQYVHYNSANDRLGLGTDQPNAALSVAQDGVEIIIGTVEGSKARLGTYASHDIELVTDNTARIIIEAGGDIRLGNKKSGSIQVSINGKLKIGSGTMDTRVDLHVNGGIKFNDRVHTYASASPDYGAYNRGDIIWNSEPEIKKHVGWVCVKSGDPGTWLPFGEIKERDR
jgi:hypothetical protein